LQDDALPDFTPKFGSLWLTKDSSLVDFVDDGNATGGHGLLVSEKALAVLSDLSLPPNRAYALETIQNDKKFSAQYYWLQILSVDYYDWIDFSQSQFQSKSRFEMDPNVSGDLTKIDDAQDLRTVLETLGQKDMDLFFSKLVFNKNYRACCYDIFWLDRLHGILAADPIVTERLKETLEKNDLVGYHLKEVDIICG
jgi:hypothetical protein